ncbi:MAG: hypothetical protein HRU26_16630 [Psychroserpens sp.]|nr:hypothetical protein [Psychroserpens sp.]
MAISKEKKELLAKLAEQGHDTEKYKRLSVDKLKAKLEDKEPKKEKVEEVSEVTDQEGEPSAQTATDAFELDVLNEKLEKALSNAIKRKHSMKARFLTLIKLTLKTRNPSARGLQMSYKRIFPAPHPKNNNADALEIYELFKKLLKI